MSPPGSQAFSERFSRQYEHVADAYRHRPVKAPAVVIMDTNFFISGEDPALIPGDYFAEGGYESMFRFQTEKIASHLERLPDDDYIPVLFPWYGTVVVQSALGSQIVFSPTDEPSVEAPIIHEPADIKRLRLPDPERDGLMPRVLRCIDYMREHSEYPVSVTDPQGPFSLALSLGGIETVSFWMYDHPSAVHELMEFCTEAFIEWVKVQKRHAGQPLQTGAFPHGFIVLPDGYGGVGLSDDDCTIMPPSLYREFVVPYIERVFEAFGGGTLHFCGSATQQIDNFLAIKGLTGINNWCMGDFAAVRQMQDRFEDRIAIMVCDTAPLDIEGYFSELVSVLEPKGIIVGPYPAAQDALVNGRVVHAPRSPHQTGAEAWRVLRSLTKPIGGGDAVASASHGTPTKRGGTHHG